MKCTGDDFRLDKKAMTLILALHQWLRQIVQSKATIKLH